jgi:hypothetical protein
MKRLLICLLVLSAAVTATAQYLPLMLDQTITLRNSSEIWDMMPHPSGYFVWAQAIVKDSTHTLLFWGRTDSLTVDSLDLNIGAPLSVALFWKQPNDPCVVLSSRTYLGTSIYDNTTFRIYDLAEGRPDSAYWLWPGSWYRHPFNYYNWDEVNYRISTIAFNPSPPLPSRQVLLLVVHDYHYWGYEHGFGGTSYSHPAYCVANMLLGSHSPLTRAQAGANSGATWISLGDTIAILYSGTDSWSYTTSSGYTSSVLASRSGGDSLIASDSLWSCSSSSSGQCSATGSLTATYDAANRVLYCFTFLSGTYGVVTSPSSSTPIWTVSGSYISKFVAEVVSSNTTEEFLLYDTSAHAFDIRDAMDGHSYGVTDTILIPEDGGARIIGRYDSTSRRLAFRDGQQLKLYRFGQYLATGERTAPLLTSLALSSYPNPFNPSTTISFALERETDITLSIFDLTGRRVRTLTEGKWNAGTHDVHLDGAALPSGLYFARLRAGGLTKTQKLVLLK